MVPCCKHWLLVEKPGHFRDVLAGLIRAIPGEYKLSIADTAPDALALAKAIRPELVIFGKGLNHLDLLVAIQQIRQADQDLAILVLTGEFQMRAKLLASGANQVITSDQPVGEIIATIHQMNPSRS